MGEIWKWTGRDRRTLGESEGRDSRERQRQGLGMEKETDAKGREKGRHARSQGAGKHTQIKESQGRPGGEATEEGFTLPGEGASPPPLP